MGLTTPNDEMPRPYVLAYAAENPKTVGRSLKISVNKH